MPECEVVLQGVDAGGKKSPLASAWVYWRQQGKLTLLRSDGAGRLFALPAQPPIDRSRWWEYLQRFTTAVDAQVELCTSRGAGPVPDALLPPASFVARKAALLPGATAAVAKVAVNAANKLVSLPTSLIDVDDVAAALTSPAELTLWPVTWSLHADDYPTAGLAQGAALFTGTGTATAANFPTAIAPPADKVPRERSLRVAGTVDARATALSFKLADAAGKPIALRDAAGNAAVRIAAAVSGGKFSADLFLAAPAPGFGAVVLVGEIAAAGKTFVAGFAGHLCGLQVALVDDFPANAAGTQRGPVPGEQLHVDVLKQDPPATETLASARSRRLVVYDVPERVRTGRAAHAPQLPLWMAELQLVGVPAAGLSDLMAHAYAAVNGGLVNPFAPVTLALELQWKFGLPKQGLNAGVFVEPAEAKQRVELHFDSNGDLTSADGKTPKVPMPAELREAFTKAPVVATDPVANRRLPTVLLAGAQRPWLPWPRHALATAAVRKDAIVVEFQPRLLNFVHKEAVRIGDGLCELTSLAVGFGDKTDATNPLQLQPVTIGASSSGAAPDPADPVVRLPPFRASGAGPGKVTSSSIFVMGKPLPEWFNTDFRPGRQGAPTLFTNPVGQELDFRKVWDSMTALTGHAQLTVNEWIAFFAIMYNETGGTFRAVPETGGDPHFFNQLLPSQNLPDGKASYNGFLGNRKAGNQLAAANPPFWAAAVLTDPTDVAVWNQTNNLPTNLGVASPQHPGTNLALYPGVGVWPGGAIPEAQKTAIRGNQAHECDFSKYRGRGLNQLTGRGTYLAHMEKALAEAGFHADFAQHGKDRPSDLMTNAQLDTAVLTTPHVYNTAFRSFHANQLGQLAQVNQAPPVFFGVGAATGGGAGYGHRFEARCQAIRTEMTAAGVILL